MKKNICIYKVLLLAMSFLSCTANQKDGITHFDWADVPEPIFLEGDSVAFDDILMMPTRIAVIDSFILMKNQNVERFFYLYNLNTKQKVGERMPFGIGPNEVLDPVWVSMPDNCLGVFDRHKRRMQVYSKNSFFATDTASPIQQFAFNELLINPIFLPGQGVVSCTMQFDSNKFVAVGLDGNKTTYFGDYPDSYNDMTILEKNTAFMGDIAVKPDATRWVMMHKSTDMFEIYDNNLKLLKRIQGPDHIIPEVRETGEGIHRSAVSREAYFFPVAKKDYIYVLYDGRVYDIEDRTRYLRDKLFVFDWEGNLMKYYKLSKPIFHFDIDEERGVLYGLSDNPEFHVLSFSLKE